MNNLSYMARREPEAGAPVTCRRDLGWLSRGADKKRPQVWANDRPALRYGTDMEAGFRLALMGRGQETAAGLGKRPPSPSLRD